MQCFARATGGNEVSPHCCHESSGNVSDSACVSDTLLPCAEHVEASAHVISCHGRDSCYPHFADEEGRFREVK